MAVYEAKEWTRMWYDEAPDRTTPRVMLIGDSITAGYTPAVNRHLGGALRADSLAGSKGLDHPFFTEEIDFFARQFGFSYRLIHFNNGLHGGHLSAEEYGRLLEEKVAWLLRRFPEAVLTLATSTGVCAPGPERTLDPARNNPIIARNERVLETARRHGLAVDDLYSAMLGHPEWRADDSCHFNAQGADEQGRIVAGFIRERIQL